MATVAIRKLPSMVAESIARELVSRGVEVDDPDCPDTPFVELVGVLGSSWDDLPFTKGDSAPPNRIGTVVVTDQHDLNLYRRAYQARAAVAHLDLSASAAADVIQARIRGEILVPAGILEVLAQSDSAKSLSPGERLVLQHIGRGLTVGATAEATFYSERHVRRLLQAAMAKAGTNDRREAIAYFHSELDPT